MNPIWSVSLQAMQSAGRQVESIAANLVNASTVGYRREVSIEQPFATVTNQLMADSLVESPSVAGSGSGLGDTAAVGRDTRSGTLRSTGQALDVALTAAGYFEVQTPDGPAYTRDGQFAIDERGHLVAQTSRYALAGIEGEIQLAPGAVTISANGRISQGTRTVAQLKVVAPDTNTRLQSIGQGLAVFAGPIHQVPQDQIRLKQGFVENSNVDTAHEMLQLMQHMRHFESMYRMAQAYDDMMGTAVKKLGDL